MTEIVDTDAYRALVEKFNAPNPIDFIGGRPEQSALKFMQNIAGIRTKDSESYANLSLPAPRVVTVNYPKGSKMARNVTNIIDSVNDPVKFAQRIARNKPWVIFTCSDDSTDWYPLDRFGSYTDAVTEIRRCIGQDSRNGFKPTGGYVVAYVPY